MSGLSPDRVLPRVIRGRLQYHYRRHGAELRRFRLDVQRMLEIEVDRLRESFAEGPLLTQSEVVTEAIGGYLVWLGWCVWCCSHLAPPLGLTGPADTRRLAAAALVYCGPRLIDDALDDHRDYKGKHPTTLGVLARCFPDREAASLRVNTALLGTWVILHGPRRLERHGGCDLAHAILGLCHRVAPGAILETLHPTPLDQAQYRQVVECKAALYDQILYRGLLDPVGEPERGRLLHITSRLSALAQYLNDFNDRGEDGGKGRQSTFGCFRDEDAFWRTCRQQADEIIASLDALPTDLGNAMAAALVETVDAAARISTPSPGQTSEPWHPAAGGY